MSEGNKNNKPSVVNLCGNGCCPVADFSKQDIVTVSDEGQYVTFTKEQVVEFVKELLNRGFLD